MYVMEVISGIIFILLGVACIYGSVRIAEVLVRHTDVVTKEAYESGDIDQIHNAQIEAEEPEGGCLVLGLLVFGLGLVVYGLGGVFGWWSITAALLEFFVDSNW